ncbi:MAG: hypothetical protein WBB25_04020 [Sulfitobacter sp.]
MSEPEKGKVQEGVIKDLGLLAIKSLITVNSGAFIVILSFLANADLNSDVYVVSIQSLKVSLVCFLIGIGAVASGIALAYISAQRIAAGQSQLGKTLFWFLFWMVGPQVLAFVAFVAGVSIAILGIVTL